MKKDLFIWYFVAVLIAAGLMAALFPRTVQHLYAENIFVAPPHYSPRALFVGDIMLDRDVAVHAREAGDGVLFAGVRDLFANYRLRIGNLEGTITTNPSIAEVDHTTLRFTFDPHFAQVLAQTGFDALSSANNHSLDFNEEGYTQTRNYLSTAQIASFGSALNDEHLAVSLKLADKKLCLVGYHELFKPDPAPVIAKIQEVRPMCDYVVVMPHWGVEYQHEPTTQQVALAHQFIDAGADVVIGGHPHVVEPLEIYKNKAIFYSLGNFIFDQHWRPEVKRGLTVGIEFGDTSTRFTLVPVTTSEEAAVADAETTKAVLSEVVTPDLSSDIANSILTTSSFELAK